MTAIEKSPRVQFIDHYDVIENLVRKGYPKRTIHEQLTNDGLLNMSYSQFARSVNKFFGDLSPTNVTPHNTTKQTVKGAQSVKDSERKSEPKGHSRPTAKRFEFNPNSADASKSLV